MADLTKKLANMNNPVVIRGARKAGVLTPVYTKKTKLKAGDGLTNISLIEKRIEYFLMLENLTAEKADEKYNSAVTAVKALRALGQDADFYSLGRDNEFNIFVQKYENAHHAIDETGRVLVDILCDGEVVVDEYPLGAGATDARKLSDLNLPVNVHSLQTYARFGVTEEHDGKVWSVRFTK